MLERALEQEHCFVVITGRRRIGKTRLVREVLKDHDHLDLFLPRKRMSLALEQLSRSIEEQTGYSPKFDNIRDLLGYVLRLRKTIIFLDEISNLDHINKGAYSDIQEMMDRLKGDTRVRLIVDGSYAGVMKRVFEDRKEPLFGRATNMLELQPLPVSYSVKMLMEGGIDFESSIEMYSLLGGIPRYLELAREYRDLSDMVKGIFSPGSVFLYEGENVLIQEFGASWDTYFSILEVISRGKFGPTSIADQLGMEVQMLPKYLETLKRLDLVGRKRPIFGKPRHVRYEILDPFFAFWFAMCYPRIGLLKDGRSELEMEAVRTFIGGAMEKVVVDILFETSSFPFRPDQVGSWWDRSGNEVDILFHNKKEKKIGVGEVKWRRRKVGKKEVKDLLDRIEMIDWHNRTRKEYPFIVSGSGFKKEAIELMRELKVYGFTIKDLRRSVLKKVSLQW